MNPAIPIAGPAVALTAAQRETLRALLDTLVPRSADGRLPGAGEMETLVRQIAAARTVVPALRELLDVLDREAIAAGGAAFAALDGSMRLALLQRVRTRNAAALDALALETVTGYYQQDRVLEALGLEARPPYPQGYSVDAGDLSLLAPVIARGKIYRDVDD